jgi:hypothetical protein
MEVEESGARGTNGRWLALETVQVFSREAEPRGHTHIYAHGSRVCTNKSRCTHIRVYSTYSQICLHDCRVGKTGESKLHGQVSRLDTQGGAAQDFFLLRETCFGRRPSNWLDETHHLISAFTESVLTIDINTAANFSAAIPRWDLVE